MPKDLMFSIDIGAMMNHEKTFPSPNEFKPDRFLNNSMTGKYLTVYRFGGKCGFHVLCCHFYLNISSWENFGQFLVNCSDTDPYWFIPFGAGRRNCIGQVFAVQELKIILLRLCSTVRIKNRVLERDNYGRPPHKMIGLTFKIKPNSLQQQFEYK